MDEVGIGDLVRELSPEALQYYADMELSAEWPTYEKPLYGKFVRLGEVILLGTAINYGPVDYMERRKSLKHIDMMMFGCRFMGEEVVDRINASAPKDGAYLKDRWPLVDAGWSKIAIGPDGKPAGLALDDESFDYGRALEPVRQHTGEIAQSILGIDIEVITK